ncbi:4Fe-4S dicluster domain-containing protein [Bacillus sp. Marseille-P3661]|uniref:4Fe-4S dicluster domain-containing protein n=1 Tax=Bacillus sp. Marseille-P3661 TaxID=1936234 RepID=UPI000C851378|nr:4Fe-4S dicluster domain-containing protein [Bacillus sp. Marseille-P3661]
MSKYIKLVDVTRCDGCRACMVACKNWNDLPPVPEKFSGSYQSHETLNAQTWNLITFKEHEDANGNFEWLFRHKSCFHCNDAGCEKVCPENAISYTEFGSVVVDNDACVGCGYCVEGCPFDVIQLADYIDEKGKEYRKAQKCTLCTDRLYEGLMPACANTCHAEAIVFGEEEEMLKLAQERLDFAKSRYPKANIYNPQGVDGTHTVYVLGEDPQFYDLPLNPKVPTSAKIWKDYAQPLGKALLGGTTMAVLGAMVANKFLNQGNKHEGGESDEQ